MMVICTKHGGQAAMQVSRDAVDAKGLVPPDMQLIAVEFEHEGTTVERFYLSPEAAKRLGFDEPTVLPLPEQYPKWIGATQWSAVCVKCFEESRC